MDAKTAKNLATVLGVAGLLLIFAGPAFHFIPTNTGIFLALSCWVIGGALGAYSKREKKEVEEKKGGEKK